MSFSNATIAAPRANKPHIVVRERWWRVSAMPKPLRRDGAACGLWDRAHSFVYRLNWTPGDGATVAERRAVREGR